jgi:hypothetical protein
MKKARLAALAGAIGAASMLLAPAALASGPKRPGGPPPVQKQGYNQGYGKGYGQGYGSGFNKGYNKGSAKGGSNWGSGFATGAILGLGVGVIATSPKPWYPPPPRVYYAPPPVYYVPPPVVYAPPPPPVYYNRAWTEAHVEWCVSRYRSYNPATNLFVGYDGFSHQCVGPYWGG